MARKTAETQKRIAKIVSQMKQSDKHYLEKLVLLSQLLQNPRVGHIICKDIVEWCKEMKLKPTCNHEDGGSWWTCSMK